MHEHYGFQLKQCVCKSKLRGLGPCVDLTKKYDIAMTIAHVKLLKICKDLSNELHLQVCSDYHLIKN